MKNEGIFVHIVIKKVFSNQFFLKGLLLNYSYTWGFWPKIPLIFLPHTNFKSKLFFPFPLITHCPSLYYLCNQFNNFSLIYCYHQLARIFFFLFYTTLKDFKILTSQNISLTPITFYFDPFGLWVKIHFGEISNNPYQGTVFNKKPTIRFFNSKTLFLKDSLS